MSTCGRSIGSVVRTVKKKLRRPTLVYVAPRPGGGARGVLASCAPGPIPSSSPSTSSATPWPTARSRPRRSRTGATRSRGELRDGTEYKVSYPSEFADELTNELLRRRAGHRDRGRPAAGVHLGLAAVQHPPAAAALRPVPVLPQRHAGRRQPGHAVRQGQGQAVEQGPAQGHLRRRRRLRRGGRGAPRDQGVPPEPGQVPGHRRQDPQGRPAGRPARHRQDPAGPGRRRRGRRPVLLHLGLRLRRDVRRRRRLAACATCSSRPRPRRPPSCSSTRSTPSAATGAPAWAAATTSASRRSTSCSSRWTASTATPA